MTTAIKMVSIFCVALSPLFATQTGTKLMIQQIWLTGSGLQFWKKDPFDWSFEHKLWSECVFFISPNKHCTFHEKDIHCTESSTYNCNLVTTWAWFIALPSIRRPEWFKKLASLTKMTQTVKWEHSIAVSVSVRHKTVHPVQFVKM